jgi:hypothetical protein
MAREGHNSARFSRWHHEVRVVCLDQLKRDGLAAGSASTLITTKRTCCAYAPSACFTRVKSASTCKQSPRHSRALNKINTPWPRSASSVKGSM